MLDLNDPRLHARWPYLAVAAVLSLVYWALTDLRFFSALAGVAVVAAVSILWPADATPEVQRPLVPESEPAATQNADERPLQATFDLTPFLEGIPEPALLLSPASSVTAANKAAMQDLKLKLGAHISLTLRSPDMQAAIDSARITGKPATAKLSFKVPVERTLTLRVTPLPAEANRNGTPDLLLVFRDDTEATQLSELRADFVANASHELRTPLASVKGFIETLQGAAKDDPAARERFLGIMHAEASRMTRLIDDLLSLSRVEMREHVRPVDLVDLKVLAGELAATCEPVAQRAHRHLVVELADAPLIVQGDRDELEQVMQNLVQNAIKYGRDGGEVKLMIRPDGNRISISVTDDGIGIAPEHLPRLTERFYRVSAKDSRERGGTGLGLAIVKHIVNRHRGGLHISSTLGKGSTFTVSLPVPGAGS